MDGQKTTPIDADKAVGNIIERMREHRPPNCARAADQDIVNEYFFNRVLHIPDESARKTVAMIKAEASQRGSSISFGPSGFSATGGAVVIALSILVVILAADRWAPKSWRFWEPGPTAAVTEQRLPDLTTTPTTGG